MDSKASHSLANGAGLLDPQPPGAWAGAWGAPGRVWSQRTLYRGTVKHIAPILILIIVFITASTAFYTSPNRRACWNRVPCNLGHRLECDNGCYVTLRPGAHNYLILQGKIYFVFVLGGSGQWANIIGARGIAPRALKPPRGATARHGPHGSGGRRGDGTYRAGR